MRYDMKFNHDFLILKIIDKYKENTLNKNLFLFCSDVKYFTLVRLRTILINRSFFINNEMVKISKVLSLSDEEIIKCFFEQEKE